MVPARKSGHLVEKITANPMVPLSGTKFRRVSAGKIGKVHGDLGCLGGVTVVTVTYRPFSKNLQWNSAI